ncbi:unnamed protein product [Rangifer tarandus platyrhynchus]|uniref:Uncharacterized protein n=2 Tax=Rangifer tarandus platyrhynchus TaxID=3082113 RepID=A0AC59Z196_RANTA|nr:unnamed protein product [Rangifer tarandus platyrhynchus]
MPHSGRGLPSPGAQRKVPTLGEGLEGTSGEGGHLNTRLWLPSASVGTYPAATRPPPQHRCPLGTPQPPSFCFCKNNQKHLNVLPSFTHTDSKNKNQHKSLFF